MQIKFFLHSILVLIFLFNVSCSSNTKQVIEVRKTVPLEILYKEAYKNFEIGKYNEAVELFDRVERDYSYTEWAPKSLLMKSFIYYETLNYVRALTNLQKFKKRYSGDKNIAYAEYLIAMCLFEQINFANLSQENTELALKQFNKIIEQFPNTDYANDAKFKINLINEQFAAKEMYLARYYAKRQKWTPALYRLNNVVKKYETSIFIEEALHRLVEINYKIGNINSAKKYASILGYNYNDSDWYKKSYNIVQGTSIPLSKDKKKISLKDKLKQLINLQ
jgi:outer membrane protein assembly factor BamD